VSRHTDTHEKKQARLRGIEAHGAFVYHARRALGLTQETLASAADCDVRTISRAENNGRLDIGTLVRIANALRAPYQRVIRCNRRCDTGQHR
jgi:transcriptional regulator with XRE-family HTH domain